MAHGARSIDLDDSLQTPKTLYASATIAPPGAVIHISGQVGCLKDGRIPPCYESQIQLALLKLRRVMIAAGARVCDICSLDVSIVDFDHKNKLHERHFERFLGTHRPAVTIRPVTQLAVPDALFMIEAVLAQGPTLQANLAAKRSTLNAERLHNSASEVLYDVIIVGAGLSGLAAACECVAAGLTCIVLEARDRVGGKTYSKKMKKSGAMCELGSAWLNDTTETEMISLARKYKCTLIEQNTKGNAVLQDSSGMVTVFPYGGLPQFDAVTMEHLDKIQHMVDEDTKHTDVWNPTNPDLDMINFATYLRRNVGTNDTALNTASTWSRAMMGQEPRDISALYFLNYCAAFGGLLQLRSDGPDGGQHIRIKEGVSSISKGLASELPEDTIHLAKPVTTIDQTSKDAVSVFTPYGLMQARKVIVSLPTPAYKSIHFEPPLPGDKLVLAESGQFNYYTKVMIAFKRPFWIERGFCGLAQSFLGPAAVVRDVSIPDENQWVLGCFMSGDNGRKWSLLPRGERLEQALAQIARLYATPADRETVDENFIEVIDYDWSTETYAGWGCPSPALGPGVLDTVGHALRTPAGHIHFVGVETAGEFKGWMEGAVRSGRRGAKEVIEALKTEELHPIQNGTEDKEENRKDGEEKDTTQKNVDKKLPDRSGMVNGTVDAVRGFFSST